MLQNPQKFLTGNQIQTYGSKTVAEYDYKNGGTSFAQTEVLVCDCGCFPLCVDRWPFLVKGSALWLSRPARAAAAPRLMGQLLRAAYLSVCVSGLVIKSVLHTTLLEVWGQPGKYQVPCIFKFCFLAQNVQSFPGLRPCFRPTLGLVKVVCRVTWSGQVDNNIWPASCLKTPLTWPS
jgi:hypothetical protein